MEPISREQVEAAKHTMIRRRAELSVYARLILEELMSHDFLINRNRKGEVWCSQGTIAQNLGISRATINRHIKQVIDSLFVKSVRRFRNKDGSLRLHYMLDWYAIERETIKMLRSAKKTDPSN